MPIKGLEKGDGVWGRGKEPFLKKVFPSSPRLPYQPLSGTKHSGKKNPAAQKIFRTAGAYSSIVAFNQRAVRGIRPYRREPSVLPRFYPGLPGK